jgi:hypothetical protein
LITGRSPVSFSAPGKVWRNWIIFGRFVPLNLVLPLNGVLWLKYDQQRLVMKKARFTETQILPVLKEVEGGRHVKNVL